MGLACCCEEGEIDEKGVFSPRYWSFYNCINAHVCRSRLKTARSYTCWNPVRDLERSEVLMASDLSRAALSLAKIMRANPSVWHSVLLLVLLLDKLSQVLNSAPTCQCSTGTML